MSKSTAFASMYGAGLLAGLTLAVVAYAYYQHVKKKDIASGSAVTHMIGEAM